MCKLLPNDLKMDNVNGQDCKKKMFSIDCIVMRNCRIRLLFKFVLSGIAIYFCHLKHNI